MGVMAVVVVVFVCAPARPPTHGGPPSLLNSTTRSFPRSTPRIHTPTRPLTRADLDELLVGPADRLPVLVRLVHLLLREPHLQLVHALQDVGRLEDREGEGLHGLRRLRAARADGRAGPQARARPHAGARAEAGAGVVEGHFVRGWAWAVKRASEARRQAGWAPGRVLGARDARHAFAWLMLPVVGWCWGLCVGVVGVSRVVLGGVLLLCVLCVPRSIDRSINMHHQSDRSVGS